MIHRPARSVSATLGIAALFALLAVTTGAQEERPRGRDRERDDDRPTEQIRPPGERDRGADEEQGREGGIPRRLLAPEADGREPEGTDEGVPELRVQPQVVPGQPAPRWLPPRDDWKLGVYAYNTDTGVVVTRVFPGSAAARTGLEPGDRIVSVNGYQIGYVGARLYPLGYELQRRAGPGGEVLLLIQNVRNRDLLNRDVRLDRRGRAR